MSSKLTALGFTFDASQVAPAAAPEAVPAGWYSVQIVDGEITPTEGGNGKRLGLVWEILEGQYKGRKIFDGFNLIHSNETAQRISAEQFSAVCHATNTFQVADVSQLFNKPHQIKVDIEPGRTVDANGDATDKPAGSPGTKTYEAKNRFKGAKAGSAPVVATSGNGLVGQPAWAAPAATPAAAPAVTTPPWAAGGVNPVPAPAAPAGKPAGKAKGKPGPKPKPAPVVERKFYVGIDSPEFANALPESKVAEYFGRGLPADTLLCLEGEEEYKPAAEYGVAVSATPAVAAPVATTAAPAGAPRPPWAV